MSGFIKYFLNILLGIDQLLNTLLAGDADESLSARAYRCSQFYNPAKMRWILARQCIDTLFFFEKQHCKQAFESEIKRRQYPSFYQSFIHE